MGILKQYLQVVKFLDIWRTMFTIHFCCSFFCLMLMVILLYCCPFFSRVSCLVLMTKVCWVELRRLWWPWIWSIRWFPPLRQPGLSPLDFLKSKQTWCTHHTLQLQSQDPTRYVHFIYRWRKERMPDTLLSATRSKMSHRGAHYWSEKRTVLLLFDSSSWKFFWEISSYSHILVP